MTNDTTHAGWKADYEKAIELGNAPDFGEPTDIYAMNGRYGSTIIFAFEDDKYLSPYFNQSNTESDCDKENCPIPDECEFGYCNSDYYQIEQNADEWLDVMYGATQWSEWEWVETEPAHC